MFNEKFWLAIAFFSFLLLVLRYVKPMIVASIDKQSQDISDEIIAAKEMKEKASKLLSEAESFHKESLSYSKKLIAEAQEEAAKFIAQAEKDITEEVTKKTAAAHSRIQNEEERVLRQVKSAIVSTALEAVESEAANNLDKKHSDNLLSQATQSFEKILH